jgi:hypothetical protein
MVDTQKNSSGWDLIFLNYPLKVNSGTSWYKKSQSISTLALNLTDNEITLAAPVRLAVPG